MPANSMSTEDQKSFRLHIASVLEHNGWNALALEELWDEAVRPRPDFLAVSPHLSPIQIQLYIRHPTRAGRLGAETIKAIIENGTEVPGWDILIATNRGFTQRALEVGREFSSEAGSIAVHLCSFAQCIAFLEQNGIPATVAFPAEGTRYDAHIIVVGTVSPQLLENLAKRRQSLEDALRQGSPRFLEELVAENWRAEGYDVEIVKRLNAGGPDVVATRRDSIIPIKVLTSCKWRSPQYPVKMLDLEELLSWVELIYPANAGLLATNTRLQEGALHLTQRFHRIQALDRDGVIEWTLRLWRR